ncbi:ubiquinone/menaquinone biosynthesis C-methylase UbiE [Runella defluvii]|uniref:Ubiquinone/menaquinone biosynthesis C-methylase UbiE n=1 Tax=Runella defluvii TaxID=370973 RepID=A0A7W5ZSK8_9BACT|nr:class I SAM-dependent methyltransferase [Runella defluvii]MBB3840919.1 ubiquinone/menaquinone biosynthesis C-methylase UbiE [Runella defluvii]HAK79433.1 methyltransferase type 11 [Runella sp.]HAO47832.1 methyltransferase type 11 [Runella sp.]
MTHTQFLASLVCPKTGQPLQVAEDGQSLTAPDGTVYPVLDSNIIDMVHPRELFEDDAREQHLYDQAYQRYDRGVSWVFETLNHSDEAATRQFMIGLMNLQPGQTVLEVGAGTGKDSALIIEQISPGGTAVLSDLSPNMLRLATQKLKAEDVNIHFFLGNGSYLPFADGTFDSVFHFGGINTFSERKKAFAELTRVVKVGGKVVIGDESMAPWLRNEPTYQTLWKANPLFRAEVPIADLPANVENFKLHYIFGNCFYVMEYTVAAKAPEIDIDLPIPGKDFVDNWRLRAEKA